MSKEYAEYIKKNLRELKADADLNLDAAEFIELQQASIEELQKELNKQQSEPIIDRKQAEFLWDLLDYIDTLGDIVKPRDLDSWERYYSLANKKLRKRFEIFKSDGYKLMTPKEYKTTRGRIIKTDKIFKQGFE